MDKLIGLQLLAGRVIFLLTTRMIDGPTYTCVFYTYVPYV